MEHYMESFSSLSIPELITKYQSYSSPCEESKNLLLYLWTYHSPFIASQCRSFFSASSFVDYQDLMQTCFLTFCEVLRTYDPHRGKLTTALAKPLHHTFIEYLSHSNGYTLHENIMVLHFKTILEENELTGNESPQILTELYNKKYSKHPITVKSLCKYRDYYLMQEKVHLDQYPGDLLSAALDPYPTNSVEHTSEVHAAYNLICDYIKKTEGNDHNLLLFLFGFTKSVEINGFIYSIDKKPHPIGPLRQAYAKIFPALTQYLYDNSYIDHNKTNDLKNFIANFTIPDVRD